MKKLFTTVLLLVSTLTFAQKPHSHTQEEKQEVYEEIQQQLDEGKITLEQAQKRWLEYLKCCK